MLNRPEIACRLLEKHELPLVRQVADVVWPATFRAILSQEQVDYMMEMMYGAEVLAREFDAGVEYHGVFDGARVIGYISIGPCDASKEITKLHKCYLLPEYHGRGIGSAMLQHAIELGRRRGSRAMRLNVNRKNQRAIRAYIRNGFKTIQNVDKPIGNGFYMNDYVMEVTL